MAEDKYKVLMIDDEPDIVDFFEKMFGNFSHIQFLSALGVPEGIQIARSQHPQVVLLDLKMPGMSGEDALQEIRTFLPEAKFVIMTGWEDGQTRNRVEKIPGVAAYYMKPINLEKVVTKVMNLIMVKDAPV